MDDLRFADIHCHSTFYSFNRMRNTKGLEDDPQCYHPWHELPSQVEHAEEGRQAARYSQGNFARLIEGGVDLVFLSFTPVEKGFFIGSAHGGERPFGKELWRMVRGKTPFAALRRLVGGDLDGAAEEVMGLMKNRGPLRQLVHHLVMGYSRSRVSFLSSDKYDYWLELLEEYEFTKKCDGERARVEIDTPRGERFVEGSYRLVDDLETLETSVETDDEVAVVLTIEGSHVFSVGTELKPLSKAVITERIEEIKEWEHPVLFLTLAHHFDNGICGHSHSVMDAANWIMDQQFRLGADFDPERGLYTVRELLDLDEDLQDRGGRRIAIDVRHMSPRSRKTYYDDIVRPYNAWRDEQSAEYRQRYPKIPVIMSHGAYSGVATLDEQIATADLEGDHWRKSPYYSWGINASDDDFRIIYESGGLMGLIFDRRILGVGTNEQVPEAFWPDVVIRQIFAMVDIIMLDDRLSDDEKKKVWDCICLGTDFDGFIHPVKPYSTALDFPQFGRDLRERLVEKRHTRMIDEIGVDEILEKLVFKNAMEFAREHLSAAAGVAPAGHEREAVTAS